MHSLALVIVPNDSTFPTVRRPAVARDAALAARIDALLYLFEQPEEQAWGVDYSRGFRFDWCVVGGRWNGWGREVRRVMSKQKIEQPRRPIPRFLERNAVWTDTLSRMRLPSVVAYPESVITPHGVWLDCPRTLPVSGRGTVRQRKAKAAWLKKIKGVFAAYPECLAVAVDYHD